MLLNKTLILNQQIAAATTTYYTVPEGNTTRIGAISVTNQDTVPRTMSLWLVPAAGTATATNRIIKDKTLQPGESYVLSQVVGFIIGAGATIQAVASSAATISLFAAGTEFTN